MKIVCVHCGQKYDADESNIVQTIQCKSCGKSFFLSKTKRCPMCGEEILAIAKKCRFCGEYLEEQPKNIDRGVYATLAIFLGCLGCHNFYAGKEELNVGIAHIVLSIIAFLCVILFGTGGLPAFGLVSAINVIWIIAEAVSGHALV